MAGRDLRGISLEYPYVQKFERFKIPYILKQVLISFFCHFPGILNKRRKKENPER